MEDENTSTDEIDGIEESEVGKRGVAGPLFLTLFILTVIGGLVYMPTYLEPAFKADFETPENSGWLVKEQKEAAGWWVENVGEYHPLILHLPIGIIFLTVALEIFGWLSFGRYRPNTGLGLFLAFIAGVFACVTGFFDLNLGGYTAEEWKHDMFKHMWMGIIFVGVLGFAFLAKVWSKPGAGHGPIFAILLFGAAGVMGYGAHFGGLVVHKTDPVMTTLEGLELIEKKEEVKDEVAKKPPVKMPKDRLAFAEVVTPIMDAKCLYCHKESEKIRGGLEMDTYDNLLFGGDSQDGDEYRTLVPGDASKSYMIQVMNLPMDDDMHMPPPKKKQLDDHEIAIITWWVDNIPDSETLDDKTLGEMGAPPEILAAVAKLVSPEEQAAVEAAQKAAFDKAEQEKMAKREALQNALDSLKQQDAFKTSLQYLSTDSSELVFTSVSLRASLDDETFVKLAPVSGALSSVNLSASSVTEGTLAEVLPEMPALKELNLSQTETSDALLDVVAGLEDLEYLNLYGTQVTDAGIMKLKGMGGLQKLYLWDSKVTEEGAKALKEELPGLYVNLGNIELK